MIDDNALFVLRKLSKAGFKGYLVGGGVRDLYLGKTPKDFDISTDARPGQIRRLFANSRTIGRRFRLVQVFFDTDQVIEVSTLRSLSEHDLDGPRAVLAPNNTYGSLDEDAQRRDITINGLFYEIETQTIIDYVSGVADLDHGIVKIIGDPEKRINRDPVRMMRVIRHSSRINFSIEEQTWETVCRNSAKLVLCPSSRLRDEFFKDLYSGVAEQWYTLAERSGLFCELFALYRPILYTKLPRYGSCNELLRLLFATIDRVNNQAVSQGRHRPHGYFLLSLILIPWAINQFDLLTIDTKGARLFHFSKRLREALNLEIGQQLNLKRSVRQEITTLLTHLPVVMQYEQKNTWPKWLKRKSYFQKCILLFYCFREATEQIPVPDSLGVISHPAPQKQPHNQSRRRKSKNTGRPAFSPERQGGVFGFKK